MPLPSSQKGTGKKGGAGAMRQQQQRSRNTTPSAAVPSSSASLPPIESVGTDTIELTFDVFRNLTYEDMVDSASSSTTIPDSKSLDGLVGRLQKLATLIENRGLACDRGMRLLAQVRKLRADELAVERGREEERRQKDMDDEERERKANKKKRKATESLAPQSSNIGQLVLPTSYDCGFPSIPSTLSTPQNMGLILGLFATLVFANWQILSTMPPPTSRLCEIF